MYAKVVITASLHLWRYIYLSISIHLYLSIYYYIYIALAPSRGIRARARVACTPASSSPYTIYIYIPKYLSLSIHLSIYLSLYIYLWRTDPAHPSACEGSVYAKVVITASDHLCLGWRGGTVSADPPSTDATPPIPGSSKLCDDGAFRKKGAGIAPDERPSPDEKLFPPGIFVLGDFGGRP